MSALYNKRVGYFFEDKNASIGFYSMRGNGYAGRMYYYVEGAKAIKGSGMIMML